MSAYWQRTTDKKRLILISGSTNEIKQELLHFTGGEKYANDDNLVDYKFFLDKGRLIAVRTSTLNAHEYSSETVSQAVEEDTSATEIKPKQTPNEIVNNLEELLKKSKHIDFISKQINRQIKQQRDELINQLTKKLDLNHEKIQKLHEALNSKNKIDSFIKNYWNKDAGKLLKENYNKVHNLINKPFKLYDKLKNQATSKVFDSLFKSASSEATKTVFKILLELFL